MTAIRFRISCVPPKTSHHRKRIVRIGKFSRLADKRELVEAKHMLEALLLPHQPAQPIAGAVSLALEFTWPWLRGHSKQFKSAGMQPHTSRPDLTNVAKTLEDRLVALRFIEDDSRVVELILVKYWGDEPGIGVSITPYGASAH